MFWYILGIVSLLLLIIGCVLEKRSGYKRLVGFTLKIVCGTCLLTLILIIPVEKYDENRKMRLFISQKEYIENHISAHEIEDIALTSKKIELNEWLFEARFHKEKQNNIFTFYPDEILDLEPIQ